MALLSSNIQLMKKNIFFIFPSSDETLSRHVFHKYLFLKIKRSVLGNYLLHNDFIHSLCCLVNHFIHENPG